MKVEKNLTEIIDYLTKNVKMNLCKKILVDVKFVSKTYGLKKNMKMNFVQEDILVDVKFVRETYGLQMIVDSGAPLSIES